MGGSCDALKETTSLNIFLKKAKEERQRHMISGTGKAKSRLSSLRTFFPRVFKKGPVAVKVTVESGKAVTDCRSGQSRPKLWEAGPGRTAGQWSLSSADRAPSDGEPDASHGVS